MVGYSDISTHEGLSESPGKVAGIELGDIIEEVNGENIETCSDLIISHDMIFFQLIFDCIVSIFH